MSMSIYATQATSCPIAAASGGTSHALIMRAAGNIHVIIVDSIQILEERFTGHPPRLLGHSHRSRRAPAQIHMRKGGMNAPPALILHTKVMVRPR